jgi:two-component SAPR family response regulator
VLVNLEGKSILIVEDEALIALDLQLCLEHAQAQVIGPFDTVSAAFKGLQVHNVDAALLDIRVHDGEVFPLADKLAALNIPFAFLSGFEPAALPEPYRAFPILTKPFDSMRLQSILSALVGSVEKASHSAGATPSTSA